MKIKNTAGRTRIVLNAKRVWYGEAKPNPLTAHIIGKSVCFTNDDGTDDTYYQGMSYRRLATGFAAASNRIAVVRRAFELALRGETGRFSDKSGDPGLDWSTPARLSLSKDGKYVNFIAPCGATGYFTRLEAEKFVTALAAF
jgi:hypothetical protein